METVVIAAIHEGTTFNFITVRKEQILNDNQEKICLFKI
jgi:hypothetical protein